MGPRSESGAKRLQTSPTGGVWERYRANTARHLIGVARDLQARVMQRLREDEGYAGLRPSLGPFLSHVAVAPKPVSAIAGRLAISKQACSQIANAAERAGLVARESDPAGGRARRIRLTERGQSLVDTAARLILEAEVDYAEIVGARAFAEFQSATADLFSRLDILVDAEEALRTAASRSIAVLPLIAVRIEQDLMAATAARGHAGLKMSHGQVLPLIGPDGVRISEIARVHKVSKQAISATCQDLEELGYLDRETDAKDRRRVVLRLTARGEELIRDSVLEADALEDDFARVLGIERLERMRSVARQLYDALRLEEEVFGRAEAPRFKVAAAAGDSDRAGANDLALASLADELARDLGAARVAKLTELLQDR